MSRETLMEARKLIEAKRYEEGAAILRTLPNDSTAQKWLCLMEAKKVVKPFVAEPPDESFMRHAATDTSLAQQAYVPDWQRDASNTQNKGQHFDGDLSQLSGNELISETAQTEQLIARLEREIAETNHKIHELQKGEKMAAPAIAVGLLLMPVGIGLIILLIAVPIAIGNPRQRKQLETENEERIATLEGCQAKLIQLKYSLHYR